MPGVAAACLLFAGLIWRREDWIRRVALLLLPLLAARWLWTAAQFVQLRMFMEQPWMRLACILGGVALFTACSALPLAGKPAAARFERGGERGRLRAAAFWGTVLLLAPLLGVSPRLFLAERFFPGWGFLQVVIAGVWAAWVAGRLSDRATAPRTRLFVWRLFSCVFFVQLALGVAGYGLFLMTGTLHLPVPGVILAAPLYRGGGLFMLLLFGVSVLLVGAAWCSQLCYFGVWDATAASGRRVRPLPGWLPRLRIVVLGLVLAVPLAFRLCGVPAEVAVCSGLLLGLLLVPAAALFSRRYGAACYCLGICPLGLVAVWLGKLSPWRIRKTGACTGCGACIRVCRYGALAPHRLEEGRPGPTCTLCRDCLSACRHNALSITLYGKPVAAAESCLVVLLSVLHAAFIAVARM